MLEYYIFDKNRRLHSFIKKYPKQPVLKKGEIMIEAFSMEEAKKIYDDKLLKFLENVLKTEKILFIKSELDGCIVVSINKDNRISYYILIFNDSWNSSSKIKAMVEEYFKNDILINIYNYFIKSNLEYLGNNINEIFDTEIRLDGNEGIYKCEVYINCDADVIENFSGEYLYTSTKYIDITDIVKEISSIHIIYLKLQMERRKYNIEPLKKKLENVTKEFSQLDKEIELLSDEERLLLELEE